MVGRNGIKGAASTKLLLLFICVGILMLAACKPASSSLPTTPLQINRPIVDENFTGGDVLISGTFLPDQQVNVLLDGQTVAQVRSDKDGVWQQFVTIIASGEHTLMLSALDEGGNVILSSAYPLVVGETPDMVVVEGSVIEPTAETERTANQPRFTTLDSVAGRSVTDESANLPSVDLQQQVNASNDVVLDIPLLQLALADNSTVSVRLTGEGRPDAALDIYRNGIKVGSTRVSPDGIWFITASLDTTQPDQRFVAVYQDSEGNSIASDPVMLRVALQPAPAVVVDSVEFDSSSTLVNSEGEFVGKVHISGTGQPAGARLTVMINEQPVGSAKIDNDFQWALDTVITAPLNEAVDLRIVLRDNSDVELVDIVEQRLELPQLAGNLSVLLGPRLSTSSAASSLPVISLILDASWSMTQPMGDTSRIQVAQRALDNVMQFVMPENYPLSLRAFGNVEGDYSCRTDLIVPLQPMNRRVVREVIQGISPQFNANSPIAASLSAAGDDLQSGTGGKHIVLLTDGMETCRGNPAAVVEQLRSVNDMRVDVIGFAIDEVEVEAELLELARLGGGMYLNADDGESLTDALEAVLSLRYFVLQEGQVVETGLVGGNPIVLPYGRYTVVVETTPALEYDVVVDDTSISLVVE
ncbi:MAG: VWA domain-containing protein [Candidatus Promineifilaceae bacterium]